jgi:cell division protein FtsL
MIYRRKLHGIFSIIGMLCICVSIYVLFTVKQYSKDLARQVSEVNHQIAQEKDSIHMFMAELHYLRAPERLQKFASKYLDLKPIKPEQIICDLLPNESHISLAKNHKNLQLAKQFNNKHNVNWRYKSSKYIVETKH